MTKSYEVTGILSQTSTMKFKPEPFVVFITNDEHGRTLSIHSEGLDVSFQIEITPQMFCALQRK